MMGERLSFRNAQGEEISALLHTPESHNGKGIVLLHCFLCTKHHRVMRNLAQMLCEDGFMVLRFDFAGNGESGGKVEDETYSKMIREVALAVSLLGKKGAGAIGVAGHSMGAMISLLSAHEDPRIKAVAFIAGSSEASRVRQVFPPEVIERIESIGHAEHCVYGRDILVKREFLRDIERYNVGHVAATIGRPLLIVHGTKDETIDVFHARQMHNWAVEPKTLRLIEGADHMFKDESHMERMKKSVSVFFKENL